MMDGGVKETAGTEARGLWQGLRLGLEAKIAISPRLCLESDLKQENIFCAPHMVRGLWDLVGIASCRIVNKTILSLLVINTGTQNLVIKSHVCMTNMDFNSFLMSPKVKSICNNVTIFNLHTV